LLCRIILKFIKVDNFNRIKNLLRNREFSSLENKAEIMREIEGVTKLIYNYLYQNRVRDE